MPTIEKKPLPPIGSGFVTINPSDKEDITSRARALSSSSKAINWFTMFLIDRRRSAVGGGRGYAGLQVDNRLLQHRLITVAASTIFSIP
jgi:hypothetical protein